MTRTFTPANRYFVPSIDYATGNTSIQTARPHPAMIRAHKLKDRLAPHGIGCMVTLIANYRVVEMSFWSDNEIFGFCRISRDDSGIRIFDAKHEFLTEINRLDRAAKYISTLKLLARV